MNKIFGLIFFLLFAEIISVYAQANTFEEKYQAAFSGKPPDLIFNLHLAGDKKQFQQGEIIPLELSFSSPSPNKYSFNNVLSDRSGRTDVDTFIVDKPDNAVDPLSDYYKKGFVFFMGGLYSSSTLEVRPRVVNRQLNEWLRFEKPGKYRLYVSSLRVGENQLFTEKKKTMTAISNILEFEVVPARKKWQQETLAKAVDTLNTKSSEWDYQPACLILRFLGTKESAKELIRRLTDEDNRCDFEFHMGLQGATQRKFIFDELQKAFDNPDSAVTSDILWDVSTLSFFLQHPGPFPEYPKGDESAIKAWQVERGDLWHSKTAEYRKYVDLLEFAVKNKKERALVISLDTLFNNYDAKKISDEKERLIKVLADLSEERKEFWLQVHWKQLKSPAMLPVLRKIYSDHENGSRIDTQNNLRDLALRRLYDLNPEEGRKLILAEMQRPQIRVANNILTLLPDKEISEPEDSWLEKAADLSKDSRDREGALIMIARYGTPNLSKRLQAAFGDRIGQLECPVQRNLLNYFLKHDAQSGTEMIKKAMDERSKTSCYIIVFDAIPQIYWSKEIEQMAVSYLNDSDIGVVKEVSEALGKFGSPEVKEKIRKRFEQFSREMQPNVPAKIKSTQGRSYQIETIEQSFINAIAKSPNWLTDEAELTELGQSCITKSCRNSVDGLKKTIDKRDLILTINSYKDGEAQFNIAQYEQLSLTSLKNKLVQYPSGTTFKWYSQFNDDNDQTRFKELKTYLEEKGLDLVR